MYKKIFMNNYPIIFQVPEDLINSITCSLTTLYGAFRECFKSVPNEKEMLANMQLYKNK